MVHVAGTLLIADTDLVIDFLRRREPWNALVRDWVRTGRLRLTAVTAYELRLGCDFGERHREIQRLARRRTLPLDLRAALLAGELQSRLAAGGRTIGTRDALIAGTCLRRSLPLATRNRRDFERIEGLQLVSW